MRRLLVATLASALAACSNVETKSPTPETPPSIEALYVPDIDASLDEETAKRAFWRAFRVLGTWWSDFPPY